MNIVEGSCLIFCPFIGLFLVLITENVAAITCLKNVVYFFERDDSRRKRGKDQSQRDVSTFEGTNGIIIADFLEVLGTIFFQQGEYENALEALEDAFQRKAGEVGREHFSLYSLHSGIAVTKAELGDTDDAARSFDTAVLLLLEAARREKHIMDDYTVEDDNHIHLHLIRGQNHQLSYDTRKALVSFRSALAVALKPRLDFNKFRDRSRQGRAVVAEILHFLALAYAAIEEVDQQSAAPDNADEQQNASGLAAVKYFEKTMKWFSPRTRYVIFIPFLSVRCASLSYRVSHAFLYKYSPLRHVENTALTLPIHCTTKVSFFQRWERMTRL